jgi:hypothetical protein
MYALLRSQTSTDRITSFTVSFFYSSIAAVAAGSTDIWAML